MLQCFPQYWHNVSEFLVVWKTCQRALLQQPAEARNNHQVMVHSPVINEVALDSQKPNMDS